MHGTIRFRTDSDDLLVRTHQSITAAIAGREAGLVPGLNASTMAGQLIVQGDEDAVAAFLARLERLGVVGAVAVEVVGTDEDAEDMRDFILDRTDDVAVVCVPVQQPPAL
jgi:hypothetical protein